MESQIEPFKKRARSELNEVDESNTSFLRWPACVPKKPRSTRHLPRPKTNSSRNHLSLNTPTDSSSILPCSGEESSVCMVDDFNCRDMKNVRERSLIFVLGSDIMTQILAFLDPVEILDVLTMPLCKDWSRCYTSQRDLWKVLCCMDPFKLDDQDESSSSDDASYCFENLHPPVDGTISRHRLFYSSFVRCMKYLKRIKSDAKKDKAPTVLDHSLPGRDLRKILAGRGGATAISFGKKGPNILNKPIGVLADEKNKASNNLVTKRPKYGNSMITSRLLGPSQDNRPSHLNLPLPCAIFSIVNWMVAFPQVEGIQVMCTRTWPFLLEGEQQRFTAQRYGLTEIVLKAMNAFKHSLDLHIAGLHTLVLLGRPLGGQEGMVVDIIERPLAIGRTNLGTVALLDRSHGKRLNGVSKVLIVLESMQRFAFDEKLQAMACWAIVNLALIPTQKIILISHGGIKAITNAMTNHPKSYEVQFRALFALINLAVPCITSAVPKHTPSEKIERRVLDESVEEMCTLVVAALRNFHTNAIIRNRACLVLHNLSLTPEYLPTLLWTPFCYKMLSESSINYDSDHVLGRSALGGKRRLDEFLSKDSQLRLRFTTWINSEADLSNP